MRLLQCYPFVVLNRLRRGNTKVGLSMKSSGILVLDLNPRKSLPNILALPSPKKYLSLLPKKGSFYISGPLLSFPGEPKNKCRGPQLQALKSLAGFPY